MQTSEVLRARYSCRNYLDRPVTLGEAETVIRMAQAAPSWGNTQPWKIYAAAGETAKAVRRGLVEKFQAGVDPSPEIPMPEPADFKGPLMDRYRRLGKELFGILEIGRDDHARRRDHYANNFNAFGAPCLIYVTVPADDNPYCILDAGAITAFITLAAAAQGMGTCILAALARYPDVVRGLLPIPDEERLVIGLSLGWPRADAKVNQYRSGREGLERAFIAQGFSG